MQQALTRPTPHWLAVLGLLSGLAGGVGWTAGTKGEPPTSESPAPQRFLPGSDWPMYRHDPALTAVSPLRGGLGEAPHVAWSIDLGGPHIAAESVVVRDVTGDGHDEFLTLSADTVTCRDSRGRILWRLDNFLNPSILDIRDFVGDGSRGILLTTTRAGKIDTYIVAGRTGNATRAVDVQVDAVIEFAGRVGQKDDRRFQPLDLVQVHQPHGRGVVGPG
jgi:hypothetical protein